jgi:uroporphyrinogen decarboxylase
MPVSLTPRQRVLAAFNHRQPDRLPLDLLGTAGCLKDDLYFALLEKLGLPGAGRVFRSGNVRYYDARLLEALGVDFRRVWMRPPAASESRPNPDGTQTDEWGATLKLVGDDWTLVRYPLAQASIADLEAHRWPDPALPERTAGLAEEARALRETTDYAISARSPLYGIFEAAQRVRGMQQFLMDLLLDEKFASALMWKICAVQVGFWEVYLDCVGPYVDMVEMSDDYGGQSGPLISPRLFKKLIAPPRQALHDFIRRKAPHVRILLHTDGAIYPLIPALIELGVDVLNPVEPDVPGNDPLRLKREFGSELVFHGHLDVKGALRGSLAAVRAEVRRIAETMGPGGGFVLAPTNHLQSDIPVENVIKLYQYAGALEL